MSDVTVHIYSHSNKRRSHFLAISCLKLNYNISTACCSIGT